MTKYFTREDGSGLWANPTAKVIADYSLIAISKTDGAAKIAEINTPTNEQLAAKAQADVIIELDWADVQLKYNASGDTKRIKFTDESLYAYIIQCRNYVQNIDGVLKIITDKPSRPQSDIA